MSKREDFLAWLDKQLGKPSLWAAKGDFRVLNGKKLLMPPEHAFDCSGLVTCGLLAVGEGDWRDTHNAQRLWDECEETDSPEAGDLAFYGSGKTHITHVVVCDGRGGVISASGARPSITTLSAAKLAGAEVKRHSTHNYRPDFRGFRKLPL